MVAGMGRRHGAGEGNHRALGGGVGIQVAGTECGNGRNIGNGAAAGVPVAEMSIEQPLGE
jgi:hypothetical protein